MRDGFGQDFQFAIKTFRTCLRVENHAIIFAQVLQGRRDDTNPTLSCILARFAEDRFINMALFTLRKVSWVAANLRNMV